MQGRVVPSCRRQAALRRRRRDRRLSEEESKTTHPLGPTPGCRTSPAVPSTPKAFRRQSSGTTLDDNDMKKPASTLIAVPLAAALATQAMGQQSAPLPPVAPKVPHATSIHGYTLNDDYFWLREKGKPEVTAYLEAENAY